LAHSAGSSPCAARQLSGVDRTSFERAVTDAIDPQRTLWSPAEKLGGQTLLTSSVKRS